MDYPVGDDDGSSFKVSSGDSRGCVGPSTIHFSSHIIASSFNREGQVGVDSGYHNNKKSI